jgi:transglutaminase-like putative cysteine protease
MCAGKEDHVKEKQDGIVMDTKIYSGEGNASGIPIYLRGIQLLAVIFGCWCFAAILMESFLIPASFLRINIAIIFFSILFYFFFLFPSYGLVKAFFVVLFYAAYLFSRLPRLQNAFYILENLVIQQINIYYESQIPFFVADRSTAEADITLFLILLIIPVAALNSAAFVRRRLCNIAFIVLVLPVVASFSIGIIPAELYLIITLLELIFLSKIHSVDHIRKNKADFYDRVGMKVAITLCGISLMVFFLMKRVVTPEQYEAIDGVKTAKVKIQAFLLDFSLNDVTSSFGNLNFRNEKIAPGGLSGGRLGKVDRVSYTNTEHLRITAPLPSAYEGIYLKGFVGSVYTGNSWDKSNKDMKNKYHALQEKMPLGEFSPVNQVSMLLGQMEDLAGSLSTAYQFYKGKIKVEYEDANKNYLYVPYFTKYETLESIDYEQDLYAVPSVRRDGYELDYYYDIDIGDEPSGMFGTKLPKKLDGFSTYEKLYREYVHDVYTQLPETGIDRLKQDFSPENIDENMESIPEKIAYIKNYLNNHTQYSLSPGKLPKDKDFVEYFVYENQVGYCAHYASAATLMLRIMGVPARYVEGYAVGREEIDQSDYLEDQLVTDYSNTVDYSYGVRQLVLSVRDYNAHAWVEVYIDGCGWIPAEFTPGSMLNTEAVVEDMAQIGDNINQYKKPAAPDAVPEPTPTAVPTAAPKGQEDAASDNAAKPTASPEQGNGWGKESREKENDRKRSNLHFLIIVLAGAMGSGMIGIILPIYRKKRQIRGSNRNQKALLLYKEIEKVIASGYDLIKRKERLEDHLEDVKENCPYLQGEEFEACMEIIQKARFGKDSISTWELCKVMNFYEALFERTYQNASIRKKMHLKLQLLL